MCFSLKLSLVAFSIHPLNPILLRSAITSSSHLLTLCLVASLFYIPCRNDYVLYRSPLRFSRSSSLYLSCLNLILGFINSNCFTGRGCLPLAKRPTWRTRTSHLVLSLSFVLSGMGDPASSYATAAIALRILEALKPPHPNIVFLRQVGDVIDGVSKYLV